MGLYELLGYRRRWQLLALLQRPSPSSIAPIVIGGCGGSGTTLLRASLDAHPEITCGPESTVFLSRISSQVTIARRLGMPADQVDDLLRDSRSQAQFIEAFARARLQQSGKAIWADKTPENVRRLPFIFRHFPGARFIHVVRDGRDVACALRHSPWMKLPAAVRRTPEGLRRSARYWVSRVAAGLRHRADPRYMELRYEDLVRDPERTLRRLLEFLEVPWSAKVLDRSRAGLGLVAEEAQAMARAAGPLYHSAIGRWQMDCTAAEMDLLQTELATHLVQLGYLPGCRAPQLQLVASRPAPPPTDAAESRRRNSAGSD